VWIAEYEEKYEASKHGGERLTNAEFMANREAARGTVLGFEQTILHSRMPWDPTPARLKRARV
jgi:hypothetical protein